MGVTGNRCTRGWAALLTGGALELAVSASAQTTTQNVPNSAEASPTVANSLQSTATDPSDIVVTARKREERLQDIPASVTAFSADRLRSLGIRDITEVALQTPGFAMQNASRQNEQPFIRGASVNSVFRQSQNASFFVDGVYVSGVARTIGLDDIERIEIVLGPQAVYFGRATFAGAINYVSRRPDLSGPSADLTSTIGEHGLYDVQGGFNLPINDKIAIRAFGQFHSYNGEYHNSLDGRRVGNENTEGLSGSILLRPTDNVDIVGRVQYTAFDDGHSAVTLYSSLNNNCLPSAAKVNQFYCGQLRNPLGSDIALNLNQLFEGRGYRTVDQTRYSALANWRIGGFTVSSVTGYNRELDRLNSDGDASPTTPQGGLLQSYFRSYNNDFYQELRIATPQDKRIRLLVGGSYFNSYRIDSSLLFPIVSLANPRHIEDTAVFGSIAVDPVRGVTLTAEGRYQTDRIRVDNTILSATFNKFLPRVTLDYKITPDVMIYGTYAEGDKPGDFNTAAGTPIANRVVLEETIKNYEAGIKTQWFDRRLTANLTGYHINWANQGFQNTVFQQDAAGNPILAPNGQPRTVVVTVNAGKTRINGLELDSSLIVKPGWTVRVAYSYIDAQFADFLSRLPLTYQATPGQVAGNQLPNTPKNKVTFSTTLEQPIGTRGWHLLASADLTLRDKQYTDELNTAYIGALTLLNARIGVSKGRWQAYLYGRNLTDSKVPDFGTRSLDYNTNVNSYLFTLRPSRNFGATGTVKF